MLNGLVTEYSGNDQLGRLYIMCVADGTGARARVVEEVMSLMRVAAHGLEDSVSGPNWIAQQ